MSLTLTVTLALADIHTLNTTPVTLITPPFGYAVQLVKPIILRTYSGTGNPGFGFPSGEFMSIYNDANVMPIMQQFSDPAVMQDGAYSAFFFQTYECVRNGELINTGTPFVSDGSVKVTTTNNSPIIGGASDGYMTLELTYDLISY